MTTEVLILRILHLIYFFPSPPKGENKIQKKAYFSVAGI